MFKKTVTLWIAAVAMVASTASAGDWYVGALFNYTDLDDTSFETGLGTVTTTFDESETFETFGLLVGYDTSVLRLEGEVTARENYVESHILGGAARGSCNRARVILLVDRSKR